MPPVTQGRSRRLDKSRGLCRVERQGSSLSDTLPYLAFSLGAELGESPVWSSREGMLYFLDIPRATMHRLDPDSGACDDYCLPARSTAVVLTCRRTLVVAMGGALVELIPGTGRTRCCSNSITMVRQTTSSTTQSAIARDDYGSERGIVLACPDIALSGALSPIKDWLSPMAGLPSPMASPGAPPAMFCISRIRARKPSFVTQSTGGAEPQETGGCSPISPHRAARRTG